MIKLLILFMLGVCLVVVAPSQVRADFVYRAPLPNAQYVSPETQIVVRYDQPVAVESYAASLRVVGSESGLHKGNVRLARDGETLVFVPEEPFALDEKVTVQQGRERYSFYVSAEIIPHDPTPEFTLPPSADERSAVAPTYKTAPSVPQLNVTVNRETAMDGYLFVADFSVDVMRFRFSDAARHLLILDNDGELVYHQNTPDLRFDFKKHDNGLLSYFVDGQQYYEVINNRYEVVDTYRSVGYPTTDNHEFLMLPNGNVALMIYDVQKVDMSKIVDGGLPDASVIGLVLQEIDPDRNVVFEWRSWDHIPITDSRINLTLPVIDYIHGNSIEVGADGNWTISSRFTDEVTKIDRATGDVIWRMGGKANEFTFIPDDGEPFSDQHDARWLPNGNLSIFDNRAAIGSSYARAVEYQVDEVNKIAYRVWEHKEAGGPSIAMGNAQRLENGNTLIGWGAMYPSISEVSPLGQIVWQMEFERHSTPSIIRNSYRAFRFDWEGYPQTTPALVAESSAADVTLYFSFNGATEVDSYRVYGGMALDDLSFKTVALKDGFETSVTMPNLTDCFYQVQPIGRDGQPYQRSNVAMADWCKSAEIHLPLMTTD